MTRTAPTWLVIVVVHPEGSHFKVVDPSPASRYAGRKFRLTEVQKEIVRNMV